MWLIISAVPAAVCFLDTEYVYSGFKIDMVGTMYGDPVPHFSFFVRSEITANGSISVPVAESVRTSKIGSAALIFVASNTRSHASPSYFAPAAITLEQSIVLPPPMASTISIPSSLQIATPFLTVSIRGFGSTPLSSNTVSAASFKSCIAVS